MIPYLDHKNRKNRKNLGDGVIPMEPMIEIAAEAGVEHCHVEQDQSADPLASVRQSMKYLRTL